MPFIGALLSPRSTPPTMPLMKATTAQTTVQTKGKMSREEKEKGDGGG